MEATVSTCAGRPWNKGKLVGQKAPLKIKDIWAIRVRLQMQRRVRDLALFNLGIDSKLRACDLVRLRVQDVCHGDRIAARAVVQQQKTGRPVQFEITSATRDALDAWINAARLRPDAFLFPGRVHHSPHIRTRQHARVVKAWIREIGLDSAAYGTHSIRRTKASLIYRRTKNLRAVQLLPCGHCRVATAWSQLLAYRCCFDPNPVPSGQSSYAWHCRDRSSPTIVFLRDSVPPMPGR
jgi:integrase